jgi:prevent-host-death family protein
MAQYGYHSHIEDIVRSANIADLRNRLTQYLKEVRAGGEIIVRDRQRPIAKIVPLTVDDESAADGALVAAGLMRKAERSLSPSFWKTRRATMTARTAADAVSADREGR